jgi:hypothetical protein
VWLQFWLWLPFGVFPIMSGRYFKLCVFGSSLFILLLKPAFDLAICTCKVSWVSVTDYYRPFILREVYVSAVIRCFGGQLFCKVEHFTLLSDHWTFWYVKRSEQIPW